MMISMMSGVISLRVSEKICVKVMRSAKHAMRKNSAEEVHITVGTLLITGRKYVLKTFYSKSANSFAANLKIYQCLF